jgi:hypothetical protein
MGLVYKQYLVLAVYTKNFIWFKIKPVTFLSQLHTYYFTTRELRVANLTWRFRMVALMVYMTGIQKEAVLVVRCCM